MSSNPSEWDTNYRCGFVAGSSAAATRIREQAEEITKLNERLTLIDEIVRAQEETIELNQQGIDLFWHILEVANQQIIEANDKVAWLVAILDLSSALQPPAEGWLKAAEKAVREND